MNVVIYNRKKKCYYKEKTSLFVVFLYNTYIGRILLKLLFTRVWFTKLGSYFVRSKMSRIAIGRFINKNNIDMSRYLECKYDTFDAFFTRRIVEEVNRSFDGVISVCDGKLMVYDIDDNLSIKVKSSVYTISELLNDAELAEEYRGGVCLVYRLTKDDYHHYYYFDDGKILYNKKISGVLHTVMPIAYKKYKVYTENTREYDVIMTKNYDKVVYMEVGALMISKINNDNSVEFKKGDHRGYFSFGASTIILLFKKDKIRVDKDIICINNMGYEVAVSYLEKIGV